MRLFKAFYKDMTCRDFQYEEGKTYHEDEASLCVTGFHACECPIDCFSYYNPTTSLFHEVELDEVDDMVMPDETKRVGKTITIGERLSITDLIRYTIDYIRKAFPEKIYGDNCREALVANPIDYGMAISDDPHGVASCTGHSSAAVTCELWSVAGNAGSQSIALNTAPKGIAANSGLRSIAYNENHSGTSVTSGCGSIAESEGEESVAVCAGDYSLASAQTKGGVACSFGMKGKAKGELGSWIVCAEWALVGSRYRRIDVKCALVDGEKIKPDVSYRLVNGEFVEADELGDDD